MYESAKVTIFGCINKFSRKLGAFPFVAVDVLRTIIYWHIRSIDIFSLREIPVIACRAFISIEQFRCLKFFARRAITKMRQIEMHPNDYMYEKIFLNRSNKVKKQ